MDHINTLIEQVNNHLSAIPPSRKQTVVYSIGAALAIAFSYWTIKKSTTPPKKLRHIPHISFVKVVRMLIQGEPYAKISKQLVMPVLKPGSVGYLKTDVMGWTLNITDPEAAKEFFMKTDLYPKAVIHGFEGALLNDFIGTQNIALASDKEEWRRHRKLVNPAFHKHMPVKLFASLTHKVFQVLDRANGSPIDVTHLMENFTLDAIGKAGFGFDFNAILDNKSDWVTVYEGIKTGLGHPAFFLFPVLDQKFLWLFPERRKQHEKLHRFQKMLDGVIENKRKILLQLRQQGSEDQVEVAEKDILTLMLEGEMSGEGILTDEELKSDLNVFFLAGHDTTANALAFVIHALARDPVLQQQARDEAIAILGNAPEDVVATIEETKQFVVIDQIFRENLRLHPPLISGFPRIVADDTTLAGHTLIPKGTPVVVNTYDIHHNPHVWNQPEVFDSSRFAPGGEADQMAKTGMAWVPFYNGQRGCIGQNFSIAEQRVMLSGLLRKYEWCLPEDSIHKDNLITGNTLILSAKDLKVIFKRLY